MKVYIDMEQGEGGRGRRVEGAAVWSHSFLTWALDESEWVTSSPGLFTPVPTESGGLG
jgi:hypothetical protein